ncbi:ACP S-malonyltransferase [Tissierella creatinini]|nr:ACP S-malonyltransferase [Tissierella creatinini]TJX62223.1 ACP S-malonyltransferase [Soehngenia saccharolytica]
MKNIGLLFPGQGIQYIGMGYELYKEIKSAKKLMDYSNDILGLDLKSMIFNGTEEDLRATEIAQPAIFVISAMYFEKFKQMGEGFHMVAGHSLGEYTSLYAAGVLSFEDGLRLVRKRGLSMCKNNDRGAMFAVIGVNIEEISKHLLGLEDKVVIANINSKIQTVISGDIDEVTKVALKLSQIENSDVRQLKVSSAFHSPLMMDAKTIMEEEIEKVVFHEPIVEVIPNVLGYGTKDPIIIKNALTQQITGHVKWLDTILYMKENQINQLYEVGPGEVLKKLNQTITFRPKCSSL